MNIEKIKEKLEIFEKLKEKWFKINEDDLLQLIQLQDVFKSEEIQTLSEYEEKKILFDNEKYKTLLQLKEEVDNKWKKKYTDKTAEWYVKINYQNEDIEMIKEKYKSKMLRGKIESIEHYINFFKKILFN